MSYKVLALKWRPRDFAAMVGQKSSLLALQHALDKQQLHHAYLFTGTRGVGKTSLARILAKCLNCEAGISANPCGSCNICNSIDAGTCVDVLEIDAASRTKVEDTREMLDNVPYAPVQARFKIYIIDEVHMLSNHSFNALLKTLEEPPAHVKFILATTDPQKLPVTILSRCLQYHLRALSVAQISGQLAKILQQEGINFSSEAVLEIAQSANGSMRDALSLLEQVIAFGGNEVNLSAAQQILGTSVRAQTLDLLEQVIQNNAAQALKIIREMADNNADFNKVLKTLQTIIHHISLLQVIPEGLAATESDFAKLQSLGSQTNAFDLQLYYQTCLNGVRDLPYAADIVTGFEMIVLRMLAFQPVIVNPSPETKLMPSAPVTTPKTVTVAAPVTVKSLETQAQAQPKSWAATVAQLNLAGLSKVIAENCSVSVWQEDKIDLVLNEAQKPLLNAKHIERIQEALQTLLQRKIKLSIVTGDPGTQTPAVQNQQMRQAAKTQAEQNIKSDKHIQELEKAFSATIASIEDHEL